MDHQDQSKTVQARITKSLTLAAWKTLVSGTVKLFHKFINNLPHTVDFTSLTFFKRTINNVDYSDFLKVF